MSEQATPYSEQAVVHVKQFAPFYDLYERGTVMVEKAAYVIPMYYGVACSDTVEMLDVHDCVPSVTLGY